MKKSVVTGIEPTSSGLLDQRRSRSDNQAPKRWVVGSDPLRELIFHWYELYTKSDSAWKTGIG